MQALVGFLATSFASLDNVSLLDFIEYYSLLSFGIKSDDYFELLIFKAWNVGADGFDVSAVESKVQFARNLLFWACVSLLQSAPGRVGMVGHVFKRQGSVFLRPRIQN